MVKPVSFMTDVTDVHRQLIDIWESVLGRRAIGIDDSFWALGGQSLSALRLMHRVEKEFGKGLPASALLHVPTISEMAKLLLESETPPVWSSLVPIQPLGSRPPFFCVHALGGLVIGFRHLADRLGRDQPFYGLQAQGLDGNSQVLDRVESMAACYVAEIRKVQKNGPYYLSGLCFGGWIAYEMARQLGHLGEKVALVAMFDSQVPKTVSNSTSTPERAWESMFRRTRNLLQEPKATVQRMLLPAHVREVRKALRVASSIYRPRPYSGSIILFLAKETSTRESDWDGLVTGGIEIRHVPADHDHLLWESQVDGLALQVKECLNCVQQDFGTRKELQPDYV